MKFTNTRVTNFEGAFRGLRNPLNSWDKADSSFGLGVRDEAIDEANNIAYLYGIDTHKDPMENPIEFSDIANERYEWLLKNGEIYTGNNDTVEYALIGPKDLNLAQRMIKAGTSDSKFLRQIFVSVDITAPLYWWKELDTYKVGTTANSTSTMHKIASTPITLECFELIDPQSILSSSTEINETVNNYINFLEKLRQDYMSTKNKAYWKELIRWLPESWLQTRTWTSNYAGLRNMFFQREHHKLTEWSQDFCKWVQSLPYANELITYNPNKI